MLLRDQMQKRVVRIQKNFIIICEEKVKVLRVYRGHNTVLNY